MPTMLGDLSLSFTVQTVASWHGYALRRIAHQIIKAKVNNIQDLD